MTALGKYFFQIVAVALFTALGAVAMCVYFEVPLTLRAAAATAGQKFSCPMHPEVVQAKPGNCPKCLMQLSAAPSVATHGACEHHAAQTTKAEGHANCDHGAAHQKAGHPAGCEHQATPKSASGGQGTCEHQATGSHKDCKHEGGACCAGHAQAPARFELPPGHPPVTGYTVAKEAVSGPESKASGLEAKD